MKNFRFKFGVLTTFFYSLMYAIPKANHMISKLDTVPEEDRHAMAYHITSYMRRHFKTTTYVYGMQNIPEENGYIAMGNHQGKYDALCAFEAMNRPTSVLWSKKQAKRLMSRQICALIQAVPIDLEDPHDIVKAIKECIRIVNTGRNMIIFPEGGYDDNRNNLQEFKSGCFSVCLQTKAPILPFVLYDAYKSMNTNHMGKVETQIHFLPVIPYEEYKGLKKPELAELVKSRIAEKLEELKKQEAAIAAGELPKDILRSTSDFVLERKKNRNVKRT